MLSVLPHLLSCFSIIERASVHACIFSLLQALQHCVELWAVHDAVLKGIDRLKRVLL